MKLSEQLIESFFNHTCTPEEAKSVADYLSRNPELAEKYISRKEWELSPEESHQPVEFWDEQWEEIERRRTRTKRLYWKVSRYAAAAAIFIFFAGLAYQYLFLNKSAGINETKNEIVQQEFKSVENTGEEVQLLTLTDGSRVELMPKSKITFKEGFETDRRIIDLTGVAVFEVAKDSLRPFTVNSGRVNTTALGTKFKVAYGSGGDVTVHLYEGKVVIQSMRGHKLQKAYLSPGDVMSYHAGEERMLVEHHENKPLNKTGAIARHEQNEMVAPPEKQRDQHSLQQPSYSTAVPTWYRFDKEWLPNVFDQLSDIYRVKIVYRKEDMENKYFIGKFEETHSLESILRTIAEINDLEVVKRDNTFYISKNE